MSIWLSFLAAYSPPTQLFRGISCEKKDSMLFKKYSMADFFTLLSCLIPLLICNKQRRNCSPGDSEFQKSGKSTPYSFLCFYILFWSWRSDLTFKNSPWEIFSIYCSGSTYPSLELSDTSDMDEQLNSGLQIYSRNILQTSLNESFFFPFTLFIDDRKHCIIKDLMRNLQTIKNVSVACKKTIISGPLDLTGLFHTRWFMWNKTILECLIICL